MRLPLSLAILAHLFLSPLLMNGSPIDIPCSGAATCKVTVTPVFIHLEFTAPGIDQPGHRLFVALESATTAGSSIVPFGRVLEGSTVFLPFSASQLYTIVNISTGPAVTVRNWQGTEWGPWDDASAHINCSFSPNHCSLTISTPGLDQRHTLGLAVYAKDLTQNDGWGSLYAATDPTLAGGAGDNISPATRRSPSAHSPPPQYQTRLETPSRVRIYQLFVRLFGNTNETRKIDGTMAENGVGKFDDINDAALDAIRDLGCTHIWLTGVLRQATSTDYSSIGLPPDDPDLLKGLAGSPYAIKDYFDVCPDYARTRPSASTNSGRSSTASTPMVSRRSSTSSQTTSPGATTRPSTRSSPSGKGDPSKFFDPNNNFFYLRPTDPGGGPPLKLPTSGTASPSAQPARSSAAAMAFSIPRKNPWPRHRQQRRNLVARHQ